MLTTQKLVETVCRKWESAGQWTPPNLRDAIDFLSTEVAEVIDARLRLAAGTQYTRSHARVTTLNDIGDELADVIFMALVIYNILGMDAQACFLRKIARLDEQRGNLTKEERNAYRTRHH